jgi:hypothetical protein
MNFEPSIAMEKAREVIERIIDGSPIPKHLEPYATFQAGNWAKRLVEAALNFQLDRDYVININADGNKVINPADSSTGVALRQNGLHQFLQIKHNCRISSEGLTTYIAYFLKYGKILGMTCTLGSDSSQKFLKTIYGVDLAFVPTYKDRHVVELPGQLETTLETVSESSYQGVILYKREVITVCKNIKDIEDVCVALKNKCGRRLKLLITQEVKEII